MVLGDWRIGRRRLGGSNRAARMAAPIASRFALGAAREKCAFPILVDVGKLPQRPTPRQPGGRLARWDRVWRRGLVPGWVGRAPIEAGFSSYIVCWGRACSGGSIRRAVGLVSFLSPLRRRIPLGGPKARARRAAQ